MQLFRTLLPTPLGDMLALASDEGLCALEFTTVRGSRGGENRLTRLEARLAAEGGRAKLGVLCVFGAGARMARGGSGHEGAAAQGSAYRLAEKRSRMDQMD